MSNYMGVDIGSTSSKVAVINEYGKILAVRIVNMGTGTDAILTAREQALADANLSLADIACTVATGYGRMTYQGADKQITEITCHAKGVAQLYPGARTIIDIGGQDAKVIRLNDKGEVENFAMNEKCAAGTGRFLEVMARVLGCDLDALSDLADQAEIEVSVSSVCTVFAESEVISKLASGAKRADVARGAHRAVAKRVAGMCSRVGYQSPIVMTGGGALNSNFVRCIADELGQDVAPVDRAQAAGAIGAALTARVLYERRNAKSNRQ